MKKTITIVDYGSGNLRSAAKALQAAANNINLSSKIEITSDPKKIIQADKIVLPGQGSFRDCYLGIKKIPELSETLNEFVLEKKKPILGICGGEQLLNICFGGTLIQDIKKYNKNSLEHEQTKPRDKTSHSVDIKKQTKLYKIIKQIEIQVNSAHHQAVNKLGKNLIISGLARDGIIESIESTEHDWCIGVQWHPEFLITKADELLISNFIEFSQKKL